MAKKALVTGGAGFIGSTLVDRLLAEDWRVDVVDDLSTGGLANLADARSLGAAAVLVPPPRRALDRRSRDLLAHAQARRRLPSRRADRRAGVGRQARARRRDQHPRFAQRARGRARRRSAARSCSRRRAARIYGVARGDPDAGDRAADTRVSPYGVAKKAVGDYLHYYREAHGLESTALALANVYGPRQDPHGEAGRRRDLRRQAAAR